MPNEQASPADILKEIDAAILKEEVAIPIYADHIKAAMFWSGLPKAKQDKIKEGLEILLKESMGHVKLLKKVKSIYKKLTPPATKK